MVKIIKKTLTPKQKRVLNFISSYTNKKGYAPSLEEIRLHIGLRAISTIHQYVKTLTNKGFIKKEVNQPRGLLVNKDSTITEVPILGTIAAGEPIEAIELPDETISITRDQLGKIGNFYALRVRGNSMIDEGIFDGDVVVIRKQQVADNGQTVIAIIDENNATLKKFYREDGRIRLQPANPTLFPLYPDNVEIRGIVVKIIRNLNFPTKKSDVSSKYQRKIDYSWDYRGEPTKPYTHCFHTYPAMFIPQIARRLLETYSNKGETICDIFCGSGTALIESRLLGRNAYGIDLNPLAIFLAKVKTTEINSAVLNKVYFGLIEKIRNCKETNLDIPNFMNLDFWFKEKVIIELAKIKKAIKEISDENVRNFFMVAFSETVRLSSNTKNGEFKLVRIPKEKLAVYNPNVLSIFNKKVGININ